MEVVSVSEPTSSDLDAPGGYIDYHKRSPPQILIRPFLQGLCISSAQARHLTQLAHATPLNWREYRGPDRSGARVPIRLAEA